MKTIKKLTLPITVAIFALIAAVFLAFTGKTDTTAAHAAEAKSFEFTSYGVTYDIRSDRTMDVTLDLTAHYTGYASMGFIYDIPVNAGDRVRNLKAYSLNTGAETEIEYSVENDDSDFVSVYMDDNRIKRNETHSYRIKYEYAITKPVSKNNLYLNAIGFGSEARLMDISVTINLPDGLNGYACYVGSRGTTAEYGKDLYTVNGNAISLQLDSLAAYNGVTFDLQFADGVLSTKTDMTPYWIIIGACALLAVLFAVKLLCFNKNSLTPIPCFSVPVNPPESLKGASPSAAFDDPTQEMDPLMMGKLIDNKVDNSDITSLIYYWANRGYIKINMENEKDVVLIRIYKALPDYLPNYQKVMYNNLFKKEIVHINSLKNSFYTTVERVTKEVNAENGKLYDGKSMAVAILFALLGALAICVTPILIALNTINRSLLLIAPLFMVIPAFGVFALTQTVKYKSLKWSRSKLWLFYGLIGLLALVFCAFYLVLVPSYVMEITAKFLLSAIGFAIVMLSVSLICRTEDYCEKLNRIVGFKDFIQTVEKDKLETMLESNPEFYYNVLPYAIVLGVSDKWADKFEGLTVAPPQWATRNLSDTVFDLVLFNTLMRNVNLNMVNTFLSHPSSGSASGFKGGGGFGGGFGGFGGGGHGGGGFRGR